MPPTNSQSKPCVCKAKDQPSSTDSICCEKCGSWMHDVCIGIPAPEFSRIDKYYCLLCIAKTPSLRITYSRPSMPSKSSTDALLEKLIEKLDDLCDCLAKLTSRVDELEQQKSAAPAANRYGQPPQQPVDIAAIASRVLAEQQSAAKKKLSAVVERLPEQSAADDAAVITEIAERCGVKDELEAERIHRHGREQPERGRIIKNFASVKKNFYSTRFPSITVRRDLTPLELQTHHALKKQAWDMNVECKLYKFHYANLRIVTLPDPKPLRIRDPKPSTSATG